MYIMSSGQISHVKFPNITLVSRHVGCGVRLKSCKNNGNFILYMNNRQWMGSSSVGDNT